MFNDDILWKLLAQFLYLSLCQVTSLLFYIKCAGLAAFALRSMPTTQ